jgi:hypothetical protein
MKRRPSRRPPEIGPARGMNSCLPSSGERVPLPAMVINLGISLVIGFFASFVVQQAMKLFLGLRAHWLHTLIATMLTAGVCGLSFALTLQNYDGKSSTYFLRVLATAIGASLATGILSFRFNIHGDQGDHPSWPASLGMTALVAAPILIILSLLYLVNS